MLHRKRHEAPEARTNQMSAGLGRRERQMEGIAKPKAARKYKGGQPIKHEKVEKLRALVEQQGVFITAASREVGISRATTYKYLAD